MTEAEKIMIKALTRIKNKSDMWQQAAQSTASTKAVPPWWNLGDIAAAALIKIAKQSAATCTCSHNKDGSIFVYSKTCPDPDHASKA